ncbi:efflux RND transporter permease subunit [Salinisphaera aquimarina]|uniref:Efflux RND transporter permease subunit n=1 Tax=Salinisphaera aquimarina TaxID=2094031 RepID=A0ABV7EW43_9GAMM
MSTSNRRGPIAWMVANRVTPNLLMLALLAGGLLMTTLIKQEVFPEFSLDIVTVTVSYPGATPEQVEQNIVLAIEEKVRDVSGIDDMTAEASEGSASVTLELSESADGQAVFQDVQQAVNQITTFPDDAERPVIQLSDHQRDVLDIQLYGDVSESSLRAYAEEVRDRLLQSGDITQVELEGARDLVTRVAISQQRLRSYGLTLNDVADRVSASAVDVAGGSADTASGEVLLRLKGRRDTARQFERIPLVTTADGTVVHLGDVATVTDGFEDSKTEATYDGKRSIGIAVYRVGKQTPITVAEAARAAMAEVESDLPPSLHYAVNGDSSEIYKQRLELLLKNAFMGLVLVLVVLSLFLEIRLAFWVTMGIPTAFLGAFLFLPLMGVTINMISMFAFIIALGIVVDDAIVAGENIYERREGGASVMDAAIGGARDVAMPVSFSILTNIVTFLPLLLVPGFLGKLFGVIPMVVITVFLVSWVEALFIMPAHLAHGRNRKRGRLSAAIHSRQQGFSRGFSAMVSRYYAPFSTTLVRHRYMTSAVGVGILLIVLAWAASGRMGFTLMPKVESDRAQATLTLPYGSPLTVMTATRERLEAAAERVIANNGGDKLATGVFAEVEENSIEMRVYLTSADVRPISTAAFTAAWRKQLGDVPGLQSSQFQSDAGGPGSGKAITVELSHRDTDTLDRAAETLATELGDFAGVTDIDSGVAQGKNQVTFELNDAGRSLGLNNADVGAQVRAAFYGDEALRQLRGRNEVKVMVTLPEAERDSAAAIRDLLIRTADNTYVPLHQIADIDYNRAYTTITRRNGRRSVEVTANVTPNDATSRVTQTLNESTLPQLAKDYPGLTYGYSGRQEDTADSMHSLFIGFILSMAGIYMLLAIPFASYIQPVIVMLAIPFAVVGAIIGHEIMGYSLSVISLMGVVALAGVVVNDSLVLIHYANTLRDGGETAINAVRLAAVRRFRPILLTTLTTFGGLAPMIFETSRQARFMIPMAISLGFGILFATGITLALVPCFYVIVEDLKEAIGRRTARLSARDSST